MTKFNPMRWFFCPCEYQVLWVKKTINLFCSSRNSILVSAEPESGEWQQQWKRNTGCKEGDENRKKEGDREQAESEE